MTTQPSNGQLPIHAAIVKIMQELGAVGKDRKNESQGYRFRGIDDVYNAINPLLGKYGVFSVPEVIETHREEKATKSGGSMTATHLRIKYTFFAGDGTFIQAIVEGEGMDSGDKSTNKAMAVAHKYAIVQVFAIPTEDAKDPENDNPQMAARKAQPKCEPQKKTEPKPEASAPARNPSSLGEETCPFGTKGNKGKKFKDFSTRDLTSAVAWAKKNKPDLYKDFIAKAEKYLSPNQSAAPATDPSQAEFGTIPTSGLMSIIEKATEKKTLDMAEAQANKHLTLGEITEVQHNLIIGTIKHTREILG